MTDTNLIAMTAFIHTIDGSIFHCLVSYLFKRLIVVMQMNNVPF